MTGLLALMAYQNMSYLKTSFSIEVKNSMKTMKIEIPPTKKLRIQRSVYFMA